jgi:hypothetical protein
LRGLDGRLEGAAHRDIAKALLGVDKVPERGRISHDLRDRKTIRQLEVRLGVRPLVKQHHFGAASHLQRSLVI